MLLADPILDTGSADQYPMDACSPFDVLPEMTGFCFDEAPSSPATGSQVLEPCSPLPAADLRSYQHPFGRVGLSVADACAVAPSHQLLAGSKRACETSRQLDEEETTTSMVSAEGSLCRSASVRSFGIKRVCSVASADALAALSQAQLQHEATGGCSLDVLQPASAAAVTAAAFGSPPPAPGTGHPPGARANSKGSKSAAAPTAAVKRMSKSGSSSTSSQEPQDAGKTQSSSTASKGGSSKGPRLRLGGRLLSPEEAQKHLQAVAAAAAAAAANRSAASAGGSPWTMGLCSNGSGSTMPASCGSISAGMHIPSIGSHSSSQTAGIAMCRAHSTTALAHIPAAPTVQRTARDVLPEDFIPTPDQVGTWQTLASTLDDDSSGGFQSCSSSSRGCGSAAMCGSYTELLMADDSNTAAVTAAPGGGRAAAAAGGTFGFRSAFTRVTKLPLSSSSMPCNSGSPMSSACSLQQPLQAVQQQCSQPMMVPGAVRFAVDSIAPAAATSLGMSHSCSEALLGANACGSIPVGGSFSSSMTSRACSLPAQLHGSGTTLAAAAGTPSCVDEELAQLLGQWAHTEPQPPPPPPPQQQQSPTSRLPMMSGYGSNSSSASGFCEASVPHDKADVLSSLCVRSLSAAAASAAASAAPSAAAAAPWKPAFAPAFVPAAAPNASLVSGGMMPTPGLPAPVLPIPASAAPRQQQQHQLAGPPPKAKAVTSRTRRHVKQAGSKLVGQQMQQEAPQVMVLEGGQQVVMSQQQQQLVVIQHNVDTSLPLGYMLAPQLQQPLQTEQMPPTIIVTFGDAVPVFTGAAAAMPATAAAVAAGMGPDTADHAADAAAPSGNLQLLDDILPSMQDLLTECW